MKFNFIYYIFILISIAAHAQIDSQNKSRSIPAVESKKDSVDAFKLLPSKPNQSNSFNGMTIPKSNSNVNEPKKEFSMFGETFGNPGELYEKQVNKNLESTKLSPQEVEQRNGSKTDQYLGDFKTKSKVAYIVYRDFGEVDGDLINVLINDDVVKANVALTGGYSGFKLNLKEGFNKIDFFAVNQGYAGANTAQYKITDDQGNIIATNGWYLAAGVKATIIIVKE